MKIYMWRNTGSQYLDGDKKNECICSTVTNPELCHPTSSATDRGCQADPDQVVYAYQSNSDQ